MDVARWRRAPASSSSGTVASASRDSATDRPSVARRELLAEPPERPRQARLHGSPRDAQGLGRLRFGELEEIARPDDLAIVVAEGVDCRQQRRSRLAGEDRRLGRWGRIVRPAILGDPERETGPSAGRPPAIARLIGDDPQQPRPKRRLDPEARQGGVRLDEGVLDGVFGIAVGRDDMRRSDGDVLVSADQFLVGHDLARSGAFDQFGIFQWTALHLHRTRYTHGPRTVPQPLAAQAELPAVPVALSTLMSVAAVAQLQSKP